MIVVLIMLATVHSSSLASAQSIGSTYTVQTSGGGGVTNFGSSNFSDGFCIDYDKSAPGADWQYTVVSSSSTGLSLSKRNQVTAALQGLSDGYNEYSVLNAIWHFTNGRDVNGDSATIVSRVKNGTYQPQPAVWFLPSSNHLQPLVALLHSAPTPTPTITPTPTATNSPTPSPTPVPSATPTPIQRVAIGGTLWLDAEDDGTYSPGTDATLGNVVVELYRESENPAQANPLRTMSTDGDGFYHFDQLNAGAYKIHIPNPPAAVPLSSSTTVSQDNNVDNDDNGIQSSANEPITSPNINLRAGQEPDVTVDGDGPNSNLTIDFGFTGPGAIDGKAWSDVDRDGIKDPSEDLLANVDVTLLDSNGNEVSTTRTNSNGEYTLPDVPVGRYVLQFTTPGAGWWLTIKDQGGDDTLDSDADQTTGLTDQIDLVAGEALTLDAGFVQMQIGGYAWDDANGDGLQDDNESGISGLTIELISAGEWVNCAVEGQTCSFSGTATVRYGANGVYAYKGANDSIGCNNDNFGDPLNGVRKSCSYQDTSSENATVIATTSAGEDGRYTFDSRDVPGGLQPSTAYQLRSSLEQGTLNGKTPTKVNVDNGQANADEVDSDAIRIGDRAVINFTSSATELIITNYDFGFGIFTASVGGEAWNDLDGDGIQNTNIPNANGVPVLLHNTAGQIVASTETSETGTYSFNGLPGDSYLLEFQTPVSSVWFTLKDQGTDEALDSDIDPATGFTDIIAVGATTQLNNVDAGLVRGTLGYPPRLPSPGDQLSKQNENVALILTAIDDENDPITYSASDLPPGLSIGTTNGHITGAPTTIGTYDVSITARDGDGGVTTIRFTWTVEELPTISCNDQDQEAESGQVTGNFAKVVTPDGASMAQHIVVPNGIGSSWNGPGQDLAIYCFTVDTPGRYRIIGTTRASTASNDSFYVTVDGSPSDGYLWDVQLSNEYVTDYISHRGHADPVEVVLSAGQHLVAISLREDGTQLDKVDLELVEEVAQTVSCGAMTQEAENGVPSGRFLTYADPNASNGLYVGVENETGNNFSGGYVQDTIEFCFNVPGDGVYSLRGTILSDNSSHNNSFYVKVNGLPDRGYLWDTQVSSSYVEDALNNRHGSDPVQLFLTAGEHHITFYLREDGTKLDKVSLVEVGAVRSASATSAQQSIEQAGEEVNVTGILEVTPSFAGEPELEGIQVTLDGANQQAEATTNQNGRYYFDDVPAGEYTVTVYTPDTADRSGPLTQEITVHDPSTIDNSGVNETGRTSETKFDYEPPASEVSNNDVYLPFLSVQ